MTAAGPEDFVPGEAAPAPRTSRLAAFVIDAWFLLVTPLIPTLVLLAVHRADNTPPNPDMYMQLLEGRAHPVPERLLGHGWFGPLCLAVPALLYLCWQLALILRGGRTLGQRIAGIGWVAGDDGPVARLVFVRLLSLVAFVAGGAAILSRTALPWPSRFGLPFVIFLIADAVPALRSSKSTLRDSILGLRAVAGNGVHARAFVPPRFSSRAFVTAMSGLLVSLGLAGLSYAVATQSGRLQSTEIDVPAITSSGALLLCLTVTGALAAFRARRFVLGELALMSLLAAIVFFELMAWDVLPVPALQSFMEPGPIDWTVYSLTAYFGTLTFLTLGSALGFMVSSDRGADFSTRFERLVARRHLRLKLRHWVMLALIATFLPVLIYGVFIWPFLAVRRLMRGDRITRPLPPTVFMALLTIVGVMFGVTSLTVVLGVMGGFERDLKEKILGTTAQGMVQNFAGDFPDWREAEKKTRAVPGVAGVTPFIYGEVMITTNDSATGAVLHGIDPETNSDVTNLNRSISSKGDGRLEDLSFPNRIPLPKPHVWEDPDFEKAHPKPPPDPNAPKEPTLPGIVIGRELAHSLNVWVGDTVTVVNPLGEPGPTGPIPHSKAFRVAAVFVTGMFEYDQKFAYIELHEAQKFFHLEDSVTGLELRFNDVDEARPLMKKIIAMLGGFPYRGKDWGQMNQNLFSALRLERVVMFVLLSFQVLIACICIIATLVMLVIEKRKEVATLKAMGARESSIMKLFVIEGIIIGGIGTFYGSATGYLFCKLIEKFGVGLNPEIYYIERLPVVIEPSAFISVAAVAMLLVFVATLYPARRGGSIAPVEGFREE